MYLSELAISNFRQFGSARPFTLSLQPGVTALVGENDCGKTAVVDAIRYALLTRDLDYVRVQPDDFYIDAAGEQATDTTIRCQLSALSDAEKGAFAEHLTYEGNDAALYVYWRARRLTEIGSRRLAEVSVRSGPEGAGPTIELAARHLLETAYLRPLRDAEREMSPGQGSRLAQVLSSFPGIQAGEPFDHASPPKDHAEAMGLSLSAMAEYFRNLVNQHSGVNKAQQVINDDYLSQLELAGERLHGRINYTHARSESARLRQILERLELDLIEPGVGPGPGRYGLGSNNLLFMACELLLLGKDLEGLLPLLLVEEPEAHLHPQRQLRLMDFLTAAAETRIEGSRGVQVILTTHSPNLSSKIRLDNLVLIENRGPSPSLRAPHVCR
jgi:putative ATP-dependent endonuclease of OLD family